MIAFLETHRDRHVCVACLAKALGVPHKAVHTAMLKIESNGAIRSYRRCAMCGKIRIGATAYSERFAEPPIAD